MIGMAAGMALEGFNVIVYNIVPFILYRCYEQVRNDICYQRLPVTLIGIGSGISYAPAGMTHYSPEDLTIAWSLPNLYVYSPCDPRETDACVRHAIKSHVPSYIRIAKNNEPVMNFSETIDVTEPQVISEGSDVVILFHGSIANEVKKAKQILEKEGIFPKFISLPQVQPLPHKELKREIEGYHKVVTVEEHYLKGGLATRISEMLSSYDKSIQHMVIGLPHEFIHAIRTDIGMREMYGIDGLSVASKVKELVFGRCH